MIIFKSFFFVEVFTVSASALSEDSVTAMQDTPCESAAFISVITVSKFASTSVVQPSNAA